MGDVKRYTLEGHEAECSMVEDGLGAWVDLDDHIAALATARELLGEAHGWVYTSDRLHARITAFLEGVKS